MLTWVHRWKDVDSSGVHQTLDLLIAFTVLIAQVDGQSKEHLTTEHLIAVDISYVLEFGLHCEGER